MRVVNLFLFVVGRCLLILGIKFLMAPALEVALAMAVVKGPIYI